MRLKSRPMMNVPIQPFVYVDTRSHLPLCRRTYDLFDLRSTATNIRPPIGM
jgi:hypothetical protein